MSLTTTFFALIASLAITPVAYAGDADVCYGPVFSPLDSAHAPLDDNTIFKCPHAGAHTLTELAKDDWIVVQITAVSLPSKAPSTPAHTSMPAAASVAERLIIRK